MVRGYLIQYILYTVIKKEIKITLELILCCLLIKIKTINPSSKHDEEKNNLPLRYDKHSVTHGNVVCHMSRNT